MMKIGILGNGQLARMLSLASYPLGLQTLCLSPTGPNSADQVTQVIQGDWNEPEALQSFLNQVGVVTYENENISLDATKLIAKNNVLHPPLEALTTAQDRLAEKKLFTQLNIPTTPYATVNHENDLLNAASVIGFPSVLKTRRFGYDGKGQCRINKEDDLKSAWRKLGNLPLILEKFIEFDSELSLIAVRTNNQVAFYPLTRNYHQQGILKLSLAPYSDQALQSIAQSYMHQLLEHWGYIGVLVVEFSQIGKQLIANEIAPRVHNSGHWTIEGSPTSQFENHLRAICQLPLGSTEASGHSAMFNCISNMPAKETILKHSHTHYHDYAKQARWGRKLGHVTVNIDDETVFKPIVQALCQPFDIADPFAAQNYC